MQQARPNRSGLLVEGSLEECGRDCVEEAPSDDHQGENGQRGGERTSPARPESAPVRDGGHAPGGDDIPWSPSTQRPPTDLKAVIHLLESVGWKIFPPHALGTGIPGRQAVPLSVPRCEGWNAAEFMSSFTPQCIRPGLPVGASVDLRWSAISSNQSHHVNSIHPSLPSG